MYVRSAYVRSGNHAISAESSPMSSPSVSSSATALSRWPLRVSAQRPYGRPSCGGSAAKLMTSRSVGGMWGGSVHAPLEGPASTEDGRDRLEQDREVEHDRPTLEVEEVEADEVVEVKL